MMRLQSYISQARPQNEERTSGENDSQDFVDEYRRTIHRQYEVDWEDENKYFTSRLEAPWFLSKRTKVNPALILGQVHLQHILEEKTKRESFICISSL